MAVYQVTLEQLGPALEAFLARVVPLLYVELRNEIVENFYYKVQELSPVKTGRYRASHTISADVLRTVALGTLPSYPIGGAPEIEAALAGAGPGSSIFIANAAADPKNASGPGGGSYAGILEGGRRQYSLIEGRRVRWAGSTQAPNGIYGPSVDALIAQRVTIVGNAVSRVKEGL